MVSYFNYNKIENVFGKEDKIEIEFGKEDEIPPLFDVLQIDKDTFHGAILEIGERAKTNPADSASRFVNLKNWGNKWYDYLGELAKDDNNPKISDESLISKYKLKDPRLYNFEKPRKTLLKNPYLTPLLDAAKILKKLKIDQDSNIEKLKNDFRIYLEKSYNEKILKIIDYFKNKTQDDINGR